ncbi:MAG: hypothetical protein WCT40_00720 [Candidatus Magasanikbacteria bacterium]|jgi:hypothetical protein
MSNIRFSKQQWISTGLGLVILVSVLAIFSYRYWQGTKQLIATTGIPQTINPADLSTAEKQKAQADQDERQKQMAYYEDLRMSATTTVGADTVGKYLEKNSVKDYSQNFPNLKIDWNAKPVVYGDQQTIDFLSKSISDYSSVLADFNKNCCVGTKCSIISTPPLCTHINVIEMGKVGSPGTLSGKVVYLIQFPPYFQDMFGEDGGKLAVFDDQSKKFIQLTANISDIFTRDPVRFVDGLKYSLNSGGPIMYFELNDRRWFSGVIDFDYDYREFFDFPAFLTIPDKSIRLMYFQKTDCSESGGSSCGIGSLNSDRLNILESLSDKQLVYSDDKLGTMYFTTSCFKLVMPNGSVGSYELVPPFFKNVNSFDRYGQYDVSIDWKRKENNGEKYSLLSKGACGRIACNDIAREDWFSADKMVEIGTASNGDKVYELSDKATNDFYKSYFQSVSYFWPNDNYQPSPSTTPEEIEKRNTDLFNRFIDDEPVFFWKDQLGNWRLFQKAKFTPAAECGKPVIYLYPTRDMVVNVKIEPNGGLTKVEPAYPKNGWSVKATSKSELTDLVDGQSYPYLFWEGKAYDMLTPNTGFVLSRDEVGDRMKIILAKLGLSGMETADFLEFWQPKLEVKPYVFVSFVPQEQFEKLAPLTVSPRPDKVIRVFMDYSPLDKYISVREPSILTPVRTGFTVVEWGGRLR